MVPVIGQSCKLNNLGILTGPFKVLSPLIIRYNTGLYEFEQPTGVSGGPQVNSDFRLPERDC